MATELNGGSIKNNYADYADSMAEEIEKAMDEVRIEAGLKPLPSPAGADPEDLKNRRILFVAIARGVIRHLEKKEKAFEINVKVQNHPNVSTYPDIQVKSP